MSDTRWLVLLCISRVGFSLIFTVYSALLPVLLVAWQMSAADAGLVQSGWHIGYLISLFAAGLLTDRIGARKTFLTMSIGACVSALLFAMFATGFWSGLLLYFVAGLAAGGSYTPVLALIAQRYGASKRGSAMGWYLAAGSLGYGISLIVSAALVEWAGWRAALALSAAATLGGALVGWLVLRNAHDARPPASEQLPWLVSARRLWQNEPAVLAIGSYSFHCWELLGMWAWLPAFLVAAVAAGSGQLSGGALALGVGIAGATHLASVLGSVIGGTLSDRIGRTRVILIMSCASLVCSFAFGWMLGSALWLITAVAIFYNVTAIGDSSVFSTVLSETVPQNQIGFAFSVRSVLGFGVGAISPWVFGVVLDWAGAGNPGQQAWGLAWCSIGIGALLGPILTWRLHRLQRLR